MIWTLATGLSPTISQDVTWFLIQLQWKLVSVRLVLPAACCINAAATTFEHMKWFYGWIVIVSPIGASRMPLAVMWNQFMFTQTTHTQYTRMLYDAHIVVVLVKHPIEFNEIGGHQRKQSRFRANGHNNSFFTQPKSIDALTIIVHVLIAGSLN